MLVDVQDLVRPLRLLAIDRLFPDRDVRAAVGGERFAVPASPAVTQPESAELGHQVEFGGPHVAERKGFIFASRAWGIGSSRTTSLLLSVPYRHTGA